MSKKGVIITVLAAVAFGIYPAAARRGYAEGANSIFVIMFTTFVRGFGLGLYCRIRGLRLFPERAQWRPALSGGFFQAVSILGIIGSLAYLPGPVMITILFSHTIMLLLFLAYRREVRLTWVAVTTTISALFGISLVVDVWQNTSALDLRGIGLALLAALATMSRLYVFGNQVQKTDPALVGAHVFSVAFLFTLVLPLFSSPHLPGTASGIFWISICALSLVLGTLAMFYGIALLGSFQFSLLLKLEPVFTAIFAILIQNEFLSSRQYAGMVIVMTSLLAYQILSRKKRESVLPSPRTAID